MSREMVIRRFRPPITRRYVLNRVPITLRYSETTRPGRIPLQQDSSGHGLVGRLIAQNYRVLEGALGDDTGEGEVFRCRDERQGEIVAVKLYRHTARPRPEVLEQLKGLAHPNLITLIDYGSWSGRFFEVMEYCKGGVLADLMPLGEIRLRDCLPDILSGLDYCHRQGIIHRDLKPNNLFFRESEQRHLLLGDFGISSYLDQDAKAVRVTQTLAHLTLDYASPELLDEHEVSTKTDYYALGITLLHLLLGHSPFQGLSQNDILVHHLRGRLQVPNWLSEPFQRLLSGLTHYDVDNRWGYRQVMGWLHGEQVRLAPPRAKSVSRHPYPGYTEVNDLAGLAASLDCFEAEKQLFRGDIRRWVFDNFSSELADRIELLEANFQERPDVALAKLPYLLDPGHPLMIGEHRIDSLAGLVELLAEQHELFIDAYDTEIIDSWIEASSQAGSRTRELLDRIAAIRYRLQHSKETALFALLYTLDPNRPLKIFGKTMINHPAEIGAAFRKSREPVITALQKLLDSHRLEEWIRGARFEGWEEDVKFIEQTRQLYLDQPLLGSYTIVWHFQPDLPFLFDGKHVTSPVELARLIDDTPQRTQKGIELLKQGWIRAWLVGAGLVGSAAELDILLLTLDVSWEAKLESLLQLLDPALDPPRMSVVPSSLNLGMMKERDTRSKLVKVYGGGRGHLSGEIVLEEYGSGISVDSFIVEGSVTDIQVSVNTLGLVPGNYRNSLTLRTNGGEHVLQIRFNVQAREDDRGWFEKLLD